MLKVARNKQRFRAEIVARKGINEVKNEGINEGKGYCKKLVDI